MVDEPPGPRKNGEVRLRRCVLFPRVRMLLVGGVLALGGSGCTGPEVINPNPSVTFTRPRGAVMYLRAGRSVTRARFDGQKRMPPVVCEETNVLVDVTRRGPSREATLHTLAALPGHARVQLHDSKGKLLAHGLFCVFPTLKAKDPAMRNGYVVELPPRVIRRLASGRTAALYQSYLPAGVEGKRWQHVAWVLYLDPR